MDADIHGLIMAVPRYKWRRLFMEGCGALVPYSIRSMERLRQARE